MVNHLKIKIDWYKTGFIDFPFPIASSYKKLYETVEQSDLYQAMLRCKDLTELLVKYLDFCIAGELIAKDQESPINEWLIGNQSFGKWVSWFGVNHIQSTLWPESFGILVKKYYDQSKIVNWRNDTIGHGVVGIRDREQEIWIDICAQISLINQLFQEIGNILTHLIPVDDTGILIDGSYTISLASRIFLSSNLSLYPFILIVDDDFLFFNSIRESTPKYISILSGSQLIGTDEKSWFFAEYEKLNPLIDRLDEFSLEEDPYPSRLDKVIDSLHHAKKYKKHEYLKSWFREQIDIYPKGVFLLQGEEGIGKSTFSAHIDGRNSSFKKEFLGVEIRTYHMYRTVIKNSQDFISRISTLFTEAEYSMDVLRSIGALPKLDLEEDGRNSQLASVLNYYHNAYCRIFHKEKLVLIIDGIDEIANLNHWLLDFIPQSELLHEGVYVFITSRCSSESIPSSVYTFLQEYSFTGSKEFLRTGDGNIQLLIRYAKDELKLKTQKDIDKFLLDNNYRFSTVYLYKIIKELGLKFDSPELMVREYICFLKNQYGSYFVNIQRFLALLSRLDSPVTIREFESLLGVEILRVRDLSIINDLKYFLFTLRTYQGSVILPVELICTQELLEETEKIWEEDVLPNWLVIVDDFYEKVNSTDYSSSQITEMDQFRIPYILDALSFGISKTEPPSWFQKGVLCLSRLVQDSDFATSSRTFSLTLNYFNYWMENISSVDIYTREYLIVLFSSVLNPAIEFNQWDLVWYLHSKVDLILQTFSALEMNRHNNKVARAGYNAHMSIVWGIIGNEEQAKSSAQVALDLDKDTGGLLNSQVRNNLANILRISNPEEALAILGDIPTEAQEKQDPFSSANNYFIRGNIEFMTHHLNDCIKLLGKAEEMIKYCNFQKPIVKELSARITMTRLKCEAEMPVQIGWFDNAIISLNKLVGLIHKEVENGYLKFSLLKIHIVEMTAEMYFRRCGLSQGKNISDLYSAIETIEVAIVLSQKLDVRNTEHRGTIANLIFNKGLYIWKTNDINTAKEYFKIAIEMLDSGNPSEATIRKYYSDYLKQNLGFSMG